MVDSVYTYDYKASSTITSKEVLDETSVPSSARSAGSVLRDEGNAGRLGCTVELSICCGRMTDLGWEVTASMRLHNATLARDVRTSATMSNAELVEALERGVTIFPLRSDGTSDSARFLQVGGSEEFIVCLRSRR